ncbi:MAG: ferrous iron transport protein B [Paludibacter sp.]|nr:ferrous iron transport protein B [Paludibacter sp.]
MKLSELKSGEKASIVKVLGHGGFRKRIVEMGFVKGKVVKAILNAPLNDPIKYSVMGYEVSLRRSEAALIEVVSEQEANLLQLKEEDRSGLMDEEFVRRLALNQRKQICVALVGNPNCGKTTLFNFASGGHEHVGNYSGVTVDAKEGKFEFRGYTITLVDLPGTYSLTAYSPEEKYVRGYISEKMPDVIINVVDSTNLERNLYLTTQLIDMNVRTIVALNMFDELEKSGDKLDYKTLGKLLGIPFVPTVAKKRIGIDDLFRMVIKIYEGSDVLDSEGVLISSIKDDNLLDDYHHSIDIHHHHDKKHHSSEFKGIHKVHETVRHIHINHGREIELSIQRLKLPIALNSSLRDQFSTRFLAIKLLENDKEIESIIDKLPNADEIINLRNSESKRIKTILKEDTESAITDAKYGFITGALKETWTDGKKKHKHKRTSRIDAIVTHKYWGYPIFLLFLYVMFQGTFTFGQYPMDWIDAGVGWLGNFVHDSMNEGSLRDLLVNGIIGGVGGVIVFLPNILLLYFFISLMEDTGYMARAAFIMDKIMHKMGLHGKSFIPLIMGFGCNVPAILATRTIENRNARMITILINPLMSCSARLPVYLLLAGAFFPNHAGLVLFGIYMTGIVLAVVLSRLFKRYLFKKDETPFVMELPPYRVPSLKSMFSHTWEKGEQYLKKMGTVILIGSITIWFLGYYPRPENVGQLSAAERMEQQENSYIGQIGHFIQPIISPLGFDWKIGVSLLSGVAAKEIVVSTLSVLYTGDPDGDIASLSSRLQSEVKPNGEPSFTPVVALGLMLFVLIYFPCLATIVAIKNETRSWGWALFAAGYSLVLAWLMAFAVFQIFG